MIYFLVLFLLSAGSLAFFLNRRFQPMKDLSQEEVLSRLEGTQNFWLVFYEAWIVPTIIFCQEKAWPFILKEIEKIARRIRIMNLKVDCLLLRFSNYIKGKRELQNNKCKSPYWQELQNSKNGANHKEEK